jgi:hypothetical protein
VVIAEKSGDVGRSERVNKLSIIEFVKECFFIKILSLF